jgi:pimeloyl-ACP methyl ester carboxylesterase
MDCKLENITVYYEAFGEGRPVIMLPGWSLSHHHMVYDMEPLFTGRDGWKRLYLDLPGTGRTPAKDWITNQDKILEIVLDFIDAVIPRQRFAIAGASAGAYLARGVVYRKPEWIEGVLLAVPLIVAEDAKREVPSHEILVKDLVLISGLAPEDVEALQLAVVQNQGVLDTLRAGLYPAAGTGEVEFLSKIRENSKNYGFSFNVDALPSPCPAPALIVCGRQDSNVGYRDAWKILENYPRGTFAVLDRAGHLLEAEQKDLFHSLANDWLDRVEEYAKAAK